MDDSSFLDIALTMSDLSVPEDPSLPSLALQAASDTVTPPELSSAPSITGGKPPSSPTVDVASDPALSGLKHSGSLEDLLAQLDSTASAPRKDIATSTPTLPPTSSTIPSGFDIATHSPEATSGSSDSSPCGSIIVPPPPSKTDASHCPMITCVDTIKRYNFMVAGPSGAGKSSFCYSTFRRHFENFTMKLPDGPTLEIGECGRGETQVGNENIVVTVIDTVGHGDGSHMTLLEPVLDYIEKQNATYEQGEVYLPHKSLADDTRVHCLFYFFAPHRVTQVDIDFLRSLQSKVPIVPVVSKADALTIWELAEQLQLIRNRLTQEDIAFFDFQETDIDEGWLDQDFDRSAMTRLGCALEGPTQEGGEDATLPHQARPMIRNVYAVISGERKYTWGLASEESRDHSDTKRLQSVLFRSLGLLMERTNVIHQEWRVRHRAGRTHMVWSTLRETNLLADIVMALVVYFFFGYYAPDILMVETRFFLPKVAASFLVAVFMSVMVRGALWLAANRPVLKASMLLLSK